MALNFVGFNQETMTKINMKLNIAPEPMYQSKSRGLVAIKDMNNYHLIAAYKKRFAQVLKNKMADINNLMALENYFDGIIAINVIEGDETLTNLRNEIQKRGLK